MIGDFEIEIRDLERAKAEAWPLRILRFPTEPDEESSTSGSPD